MNGASRPGNVLCLGMYDRKLDTKIGYGTDISRLGVYGIYLANIKKIRNNICRITRQKQKTEQNKIAKAAKSNPKKFWAYVKNTTVPTEVFSWRSEDN